MNSFTKIANALNNDMVEISDDFSYFNIDKEKEIISFYHDWSDEEFECDCNIELNFKTGVITSSGDCINEEIEAPQYIYGWEYSHSQEEEFNPNCTLEEFENIMEDAEQYFGNFSYFAQQNAEEAEEEGNDW